VYLIADAEGSMMFLHGSQRPRWFHGLSFSCFIFIIFKPEVREVKWSESTVEMSTCTREQSVSVGERSKVTARV